MNPTPKEIKAARVAAGLSQSKASELLHVTLNGWQKWEYGDRKMPQAMFEHFHCLIDRLEK